MPQPFIKFFFADWEGDAQLMSCSLAAQGLWVRMMRVMHEATPYGFFLGRSGEPVDMIDFCRRLGNTPRLVRKLIEELDSKGVFSRHSDGRIYSRRMIRLAAKSEQSAADGRLGGNPTLNPTINPRDKLAGAMPDARYNSDSLRSSALEFGAWPQEVPLLRGLALLFVAEFANCRDATKAERHIGPYTAFLATVRSRGLQIADAWQACCDAREACGGRPLFSGAVKTALSFLPARGDPRTPPSASNTTPDWLETARRRGRENPTKRIERGDKSA